MNLLYIKQDKSVIKKDENDSMIIGLISPINSFSQKSDPSSIPSDQEKLNNINQEKLNNIKMLEKVPAISSQESGPSSILSTQEKLNNIKMLEKIPAMSSKKFGPSSILSDQEKKRSFYIVKKTAQNNNGNKKNLHSYEYKDINYLLDQLTNNENKLTLNNNTVIGIQKKFISDRNIIKDNLEGKDYEINMYKEMLIQAISEKFYNNLSYSGKQCILNANLLLDGTLKNIRSSDDYSPLCQAAISAVKLVKLPKLPNLEIYEIFKNITLNFSP